MLLVLCCEAEVRRELETCILQMYYDELCERMGEKRPPFSLQDMKEVYDFVAVHQAEMSTGVIHFFTDVGWC